MIGTRLGNYQLLDCIGAGGMGAVYLAEHQKLGRRAAVKVLLPELVSRQEAVDRFFQEARAIAAIGDPGVVQVFDFGHEGASAYLVMELLAGESLEKRLRRLGRLPARDAVRIARQVATTLAAAHAAGIVHRDIKPDNLYVVRDPEAESGERVKVLDFGIAKLAGAPGISARTSTGVVMGTPLYMAPEQCRGAGGVDHRADIYALGCVLFHMVTGRPPFDAEGAGEVLARHLMEPAPAAGTHVDELDAIIARCLEKDPAARFADMPSLAGALGALSARLTGRDLGPSSQATVIATTTLGLSSGQVAAPTRRAPTIVAIGAVIAVIAAVVAFLALRSDPPPAPRAAAVSLPADAGVAPARVIAPDAALPLPAPDAAPPPPTPSPDAAPPAPPSTKKHHHHQAAASSGNPYDRP